MNAATGHPLRIAILERLAAEGPAEPQQLARELDAPLGDVAYHVQVLLREDAIELESTRPARGAIAHTYRVLWRPCRNCDGKGLEPVEEGRN